MFYYLVLDITHSYENPVDKCINFEQSAAAAVLYSERVKLDAVVTSPPSVDCQNFMRKIIKFGCSL